MSSNISGFSVYKYRDIQPSTRFPYRKFIYKIRTRGVFDPISAILGVLNKAIEDYELVEGDKIRILATGEFSNNPVSKKFLTIQESGFTYEDIVLILKAIEYKKVPIVDVEFEISIVKVSKGTGRAKVGP